MAEQTENVCKVAVRCTNCQKILLADQYKTTRKFLAEQGYSYTLLLSNTSKTPGEHRPEIKGNLHIQHVNTMHRHIRQFLAAYCGVSSKYLENYIALFVWLNAYAAHRNHLDRRN